MLDETSTISMDISTGSLWVLITGAGGGLGRALAAECARRGWNLFLTDIDAPALKSIQEGILRQWEVEVVTEICDLASADGVESLIGKAEKRGLHFSMLLNVAGIDAEGSFREVASDKILNIVRVNIEGTLSLTHRILDLRVPGQPFNIVFVSSLASFYPIPLKATYAASKAFLLDFSIALGEELKSQGVHVLTLCPGGLPTTKEACAGIQAQGFWGLVTTNRLERVARVTLDKTLKGKTLYIPGTVNRIFSLAGPLVPKKVIARLLFHRWELAQKKWLHSISDGNDTRLPVL